MGLERAKVIGLTGPTPVMERRLGIEPMERSSMTKSESGTARTPYELIGGEDAVRQLVDRFYDLMDSEPEAAGIRALHPPTLDSSREKLRLFLTGWLGGPQLYVEKHGHPRLRARHLPFSIGEEERDAWVRCMDQALAEQEMPDEVRAFMSKRFRGVADHMRNQAPERSSGRERPGS